MKPRRNLIIALVVAGCAFVAIHHVHGPAILHYLMDDVAWDWDYSPSTTTMPGSEIVSGSGLSEAELLAAAMLTQRTHESDLFELPGVIGTGVGFGDQGRPLIKVFVDASMPLAALPASLGDFPVSIQQAGPFYALPAQQAVSTAEAIPTDGEAKLPSTRFDRPVPMGVSTGHTKSTAGTIGAVVTDGSQTYALSNWHVFVPAGQARVGDVLLQPGPVDGGAQPSDVIGTLEAFEPVVLTPFASNRIDAAIALTDQVMPVTPAGGYGSPRSETLKAKPGLGVQKYGRTTQLTVGRVDAINVSINVNYGSAGSQIGRFTGQIATCCNMSQGGDSGSLIVAHDVDKDGNSGPNDRKPVALLFAGDGRLTIGNPIDVVLERFGVTIVGGEDSGR